MHQQRTGARTGVVAAYAATGAEADRIEARDEAVTSLLPVPWIAG